MGKIAAHWISCGKDCRILSLLWERLLHIESPLGEIVTYWVSCGRNCSTLSLLWERLMHIESPVCTETNQTSNCFCRFLQPVAGKLLQIIFTAGYYSCLLHVVITASCYNLLSCLYFSVHTRYLYLHRKPQVKVRTRVFVCQLFFCCSLLYTCLCMLQYTMLHMLQITYDIWVTNKDIQETVTSCGYSGALKLVASPSGSSPLFIMILLRMDRFSNVPSLSEWVDDAYTIVKIHTKPSASKLQAQRFKRLPRH